MFSPSWPFKDKEGIILFTHISSKFGKRKMPPDAQHPDGWQLHTGIDIPTPLYTPFYAIACGFVNKIDIDEVNGLYIKIDHEDDYQSSYVHLSHLHGLLSVGDPVFTTTILGYVGRSGRVRISNPSGGVLHLTIHHKGELVDPEPLLRQNGEKWAVS
jgi:murein DD-endopeptidase MepM/ murein hydrolase activator NlpD